MITDFKKTLYCQLSGTKLREVDANDPLWVSRIDEFLSARSNLPAPNDPAEYAAAFEAVYPTPEARRNYIEDAIKKGSPSFPHRVLASLITTKRAPCIFTTNFDNLLETAATLTDQLVPADERAHLTVAALDNADRAERCLKDSAWPLLAKLHGDFQSVELKNTIDELKQDEQMRAVLTGACGRFGLIVVGYSGRDESVMEALTNALAQPNAYPGGIYWVTRSAASLLPSVTMFLEAAVQACVSVVIVESHTFDELAADIVDGLSLPQALHEHVFSARPKEVLRAVPLPSGEASNFPILQCSAVPILSLPTIARRFLLSESSTTKRVRELTKEAKVWAIVACNGREVAAFGRDEDLLRALQSLGGRIAGTVELKPSDDSWALGLLYDALVRAVCRDQPLFARLRRSGHLVLVAKGTTAEEKGKADRRNAQLTGLKQAYSGALFGNVPECGLPFHEGVQLRLERAADRWWCVFEPTTYVAMPRIEAPEGSDDNALGVSTFRYSRPDDHVLVWRRELWARRYNNVWAKIIAAWATMLSGQESGILRALGVPKEDGIDAVFELHPVTGWSRPSHHHDYFLRGRR